MQLNTNTLTSLPIEQTGGRTAASLNLPSLTGMRFMAAAMVLVHHAAVIGNVPALSSWRGFGTTGVSFFFILSGFVLTWSKSEQERISDFYAKRFFRIWPLMALSMVFAIPVFYDGRNIPINLLAIALQLFAVQAWFNDPKIYYGGNPANWSLSNEAFFYLAHPALCRITRGLNGKLIGVLLMATAFIPVVLSYIASTVFSPHKVWLTYVFPGFRIFEFILGVLAARHAISGGRFFEKFGSLRFGLTMIFCWFYVRFEIAPLLSYDKRFILLCLSYAITPLLYTYLIGSAAHLDSKAEKSIFSRKGMIKLGEWSFAMYLVHATILYAYKQEFGALPASNYNLLIYVVALMFSIVASAILHELIEAPLNNWLRSWWRGRRRTGETPVILEDQGISIRPADMRKQ